MNAAHLRVQTIQSLDVAIMPSAHPAEVNDGHTVQLGSHADENEAMDDVEDQGGKSMPAYALNRDQWRKAGAASSQNELKSLENNLDVLAEVGLAGGTLGTPFAIRQTEKKSPAFKDPVMPMLSGSNLESVAGAGDANVMPDACVSSPERSMRSLAIKDEED